MKQDASGKVQKCLYTKITMFSNYNNEVLYLLQVQKNEKNDPNLPCSFWEKNRHQF